MMECLKKAYPEIKDLIKLIKDIADKKVPGAATDVYRLLSRISVLLENCGSLFCWEPTFKRCKKDGNP